MHAHEVRIPVHRLAATGLLVVATATTSPAREGPDWLWRCVEVPVPESRTEEAIEVLRETSTSYSESGRCRTQHRAAIRILRQTGVQHAVARLHYRTDAHKVKSFRAWLVGESGGVSGYDDAAVDYAYVNEDLYNESRVRVLRPDGPVLPGSTFGFEYEIEEQPLFLQFEWSAQDRLPVLQGSLMLHVPESWKVESRVFGSAATPPVQRDNDYRWTFTQLGMDSMPAGDRSPRERTRVAVSIFAERGRPNLPASFGSWTRVAAWLDSLTAPSLVIDEAMESLAQALCSAAHTEMDTLRALSRYVQGLRYVSIQMGLNRGGGYTPRPADAVYRKGYGDCKDKANLLRSLLAAAGRPAHLVAALSGADSKIEKSWPSPQQFDHCVLAIPISRPFSSPAVLQHPELGPILLFDPTDAHTHLGEHPPSEGDHVLILGTNGDPLVAVPCVEADWNGLQRRIRLHWPPDTQADLHLDLSQRATGRFAGQMRAAMARPRAGSGRNEVSQVADAEPTATVEEPTALGASNRWRARIPSRQSHLGDRLLVIPPSQFIGDTPLQLAMPDDLVPIASVVTETLVVPVPSGYRVDEIPEHAEDTFPFGAFEATAVASGDSIVLSYTLRLESTCGATGHHPDSLRSLGSNLRRWLRHPIVLVEEEGHE